MSPVDPNARDRFMAGPAWHNPKSYEPLPSEPLRWSPMKAAVSIFCMSMASWGLFFCALNGARLLIRNYL